jgi:hypothetical protein
MLLIVNADLGASGEINQQLFALMAAGRITSASTVANGSGFAPLGGKIM